MKHNHITMKKYTYIIFILTSVFCPFSETMAQLSAETATMIKVQTYKQTGWQSVNKKLKVASNKINSKHLTVAKKGWERLNKVNAQVKDYRRVKSIIARQIVIIQMAKDGTLKFSKDKNFNSRQIQAIIQGYQILVGESIGLLAQLKLILKSNALLMSDAERIQFINSLDDRMNILYGSTQQYTAQLEKTSRFKSQQTKEKEYLKKLFGF